MGEHRELAADVDGDGDRAVAEVLRADEHDLVRHRLGPAEQIAQRQHVHGGLDRGGGHLRGIGPPVDDRERLDLDDVVPAVVAQATRSGSR
jgi:hypothetical protein